MTHFTKILCFVFMTVIAAACCFGDVVGSYTVVCSPNGGNGSVKNLKYAWGKSFRLPSGNDLRRTGYIFNGWGTSPEGEVLYKGGAVVSNLTTEASVSLYAVWSANKYTVSCDANGGGSITNCPAVYDQELTLPPASDFRRDGYEFVGWSTNSLADAVAEFSGSEIVSNLTTVANDIVRLYAVWDAVSYSIRYSSGSDDALPVDSIMQSDIIYGHQIRLLSNKFQRPGYKFLGWSKQSDENRMAEFSDGQTVRNLTWNKNDIVDLYAVWTRDVSVISQKIVPMDSNEFEGNLSVTNRFSFYGELSTDENYNSFTFLPITSGVYRISIDPLVGRRVDATLCVSDYEQSAYVSDLDSESTLFDFKSGIEYQFEVYAPLSELEFGDVYHYVVGINLESVPVTFNVPENLVDKNDEYLGLQFEFTKGTPYGYLPKLKPSEGKAFEGWFADEVGNDEVNEDDIVREADIHPRWASGDYEYIIEFDGNDGIGDMPSMTVSNTRVFALPTNKFTRVGYFFSEWTLQSKYSTYRFDDGDWIDFSISVSKGFSIVTNDATVVTNGSAIVTNDMTAVTNYPTVVLKAEWTPHNYALSFNSNSGTGSITNYPCVYDKPVTLPTGNELSKAGFAFVGWYLKKQNDSGEDEEVLFEGGGEVMNLTSEPDDVVELFAKWDVFACDATFDVNGGEGTIANSNTNLGWHADLIFPSGGWIWREGYTFVGWEDEYNNLYMPGTTNSDITVKKNLSFKAKWEANEYRVEFYPDTALPGEPAASATNCVYNESFVMPDANDFGLSKEGFVFDGWGLLPYGTVDYKACDSVSNVTAKADHTVKLYALWRGEPYKIKFVNLNPTTSGEEGSYVQLCSNLESVELTPNRFIRNGYKFKGWAEEPGKKAKYADHAFVHGLNEHPHGDQAFEKEVYLYAVWKDLSLSTFEREVIPNSNYSVSLSNTRNNAIFTGVLNKLTNTVTFSASIVHNGKGKCNVSLDPLVGRRVGTILDVEPLETENADTTNPTDVGGSSQVTNAVSVRVTDRDTESKYIDFTISRTYKFTVAIDPMALNKDENYNFAVGINCEAKNIRFDVAEQFLDKEGKNFHTNILCTVDTLYGYMVNLVSTNEFGNNFIGWRSSAVGGHFVSSGEIVSSDVLHPVWDVDEYYYTISFNANGGQGRMNEFAVSSRGLVRLPTNKLQLDNRRFIGWEYSYEGGKIILPDSAWFDFPLGLTNNAVCTLKAIWDKHVPPSDYIDENGIVWKYTVSAAGVTLSNWDENTDTMRPVVPQNISGDLIIPSAIVTNGTSRNVIAIDVNAFSECSRITSVTIPATVTNIDVNAFFDCVALTNVFFKSDRKLETIPDYCFAGCDVLANISIPYSVTNIGSMAFSGCLSLGPTIVIPEHVRTIGSSVFCECKNLKVVQYLGDKPQAAADIYKDSPKELASAVLPARLSDGWQGVKAGENWNDRILRSWTSTQYSLVRIRFNANGGSFGTYSDGRPIIEEERWCVKDHAILYMPDPCYQVKDEGNYSIIVPCYGLSLSPEYGSGKLLYDTIVTSPQTYYADWRFNITPYKEVTNVVSVMEFDVMSKRYPVKQTNEHVYNGFVSEYVVGDRAAGIYELVGTIQVKILKGTTSHNDSITNSTITAVVTRDGVARRYSGIMKNGKDVELMPELLSDNTSYVIRFNAFTMTGYASTPGHEKEDDDEESSDDYLNLDNDKDDDDEQKPRFVVHGTRNAMTISEDYGPEYDMKSMFEKYYKGYAECSIKIPSDAEGSGVDGLKRNKKVRLFFRIGEGGVVKISGIDTDGSIIDSTSQLIIDAHVAYIPVVLTFKNSNVLKTLIALPSDTLNVSAAQVASSTYITRNGEKILLDGSEFRGRRNDRSTTIILR